MFVIAFQDYLDDEQIRKTHREPAETGSEEERLQQLRDEWFKEYDDMLRPPPPGLPPWRVVNHKIPLIDESKQYRYRLPRCPEAVQDELLNKIRKYTDAMWWQMTTATQAAPLLCVAKKSGKLRTVVDARQRNDNTIKDVTPLPDQDRIRMDVARAKFRSKIDLSDAYEQVRIDMEDIWKTAFATPYGTFVSLVMQQGDCNAPATFQRLMTTLFRDFLGRFVHVYLDDIFIYSDSIEDHEKHLKLVFETLRKAKLYISRAKCDLYSNRMDCLGHIIDDRGLHADADKMDRIRNWRPPRSYHEVQHFLGLVNYLAPFMPDVSAYTTPLSDMEHNDRPFVWRPLHQHCFEQIKARACKTPILKPIDPRRPETIWLICDASVHGLGALYGQGEEWKTCRPAGFLSKKFTSAQRSYHTYEQEALAILEGLMKWEDKLLGRKFTIATDHKALEFFKKTTQPNNRQIRWLEYMARFDYNVVHVPGKDNKVADCLSRYYEEDNADEIHPIQEYVNVDARLDPEWDDLPGNRVQELRAGRVTRANPTGLDPKDRNELRELKMRIEERTREAEEMARASENIRPLTNETDDDGGDEEGDTSSSPTIWDALASGPPLQDFVDNLDGFMQAIREGYQLESTFSKILNEPSHYPRFTLEDGLLFTINRKGERVLCIPRVKYKNRTTTQIVLDQAHETVGHYGPQRTSEYVRRWFWWPKLGLEVDKFCITCAKCQVSKTRTQLKAGLLHSLPIPIRPWTSIAMDFVGPFPRSGGFDYLWVIVCRLTSMVHLIPMKTTDTADELAGMYVREVVRLHGLPESIVSDRDSKFTSRFWKELHRLLGTKLLMSTSFHPQTDGLSERTIRSISQILRTMVKPDQLDWVDKLPLVEFAINSATSASTGFAPFELNYGYLPRTMSGITTQSHFVGVKEFAERARNNLEMAHDALIESRVKQTHQANQHRQQEPDFEVDDLVYLSTKNLNIAKGRARKLVPKYIGPYKIVAAVPETSSYTLELPGDLAERGVHPTFHVEYLRRHEPNDDVLFPHRDSRAWYDMGEADEVEWLVDEIVGHRWVNGKVEFHVRWTHGDTTWKSYSECRKLAAVDEYFRLRGVTHWKSLPKSA